MFKGQNVAVTGGSGFIGINLIDSLLKDGANVLCVARHCKQLQKLFPQTNFRFAEFDLEIMQLDTILAARKFSPDYIFHLAAVAGGIHYLKQHQAKTLQTNLAIITNSFKGIENYPNLKGNLFVSSVCAYPQDVQTTNFASAITLVENLQNWYNPDSSYGWSKIIGEMLIQHYTQEFDVPGSSVRLFNTYGPHERFDIDRAHVIPALITKAILYPEIPFDILGDGSQVRAFLYIDDAISGLKLAVKRIRDGGIVNIGDTVSYTIKDISQKVIQISGKDIKPSFKPADGVGAKGRLPNITKAQQLLQWSPSISLDEGLSITYEWARKQYE